MRECPKRRLSRPVSVSAQPMLASERTSCRRAYLAQADASGTEAVAGGADSQDAILDAALEYARGGEGKRATEWVLGESLTGTNNACGKKRSSHQLRQRARAHAQKLSPFTEGLARPA